MMQRIATENAAGFGNQRASQDPKMFRYYQTMLIKLGVLRFKNGRNFASFLRSCEKLRWHNL